MILINSSPKNALKIFQPFLPIFVPVGVGFLISALAKENIKVDFFDEQIEDNVLKKIQNSVKNMKAPYIFGFSVVTAAFISSISLSKKLKELYPDSIILFGGIHPTANPDEVLAYEHIDLVLSGEGEMVLPELYQRIKKGKDYHDLDSLSYKKDGNIIHNKRAPILKNLDEMPAFPYHVFADKNYDLGFILSSRGCPYKCIFCSNRVTTQLGYRYRTAESIVEELDMLHHKYNQKYVLFLDDNFLVNKERIYTLIAEIKKRKLHETMSFNFQARGDNADESLMKELFSAGFRSVFFGIETASNRIMEIIKKGETVEEVVNAITMAKKIGYHVSGTFIYGLPSETHQDRMDCLALSKKLNLDMVRYNNATPYPGTELFQMAKKENRLHIQGLYKNFNSVGTFIENPFNKIPFSFIPEGSTEREIRNDILFSYLAFYLSFRRLKQIFTRPDQGVGWFNAGEKLVDFIKKIPAILVLLFLMSIKYVELFFCIFFRVQTSINRKDLVSLFNK